MSQSANDMREEMATTGTTTGTTSATPTGTTTGTRLPEDAHAELARLRAQVERLMQDRVTPALGSAAATAEDVARRARATIEENAGALSATVRDRPLLAVGLAALGGWLMGRMTGGTTYVYQRERQDR